jgi:hypothetical protein
MKVRQNAVTNLVGKSALQGTFEPWSGKVTTVGKSITDQSRGNAASLDRLFADREIDFVKVDGEGAEVRILEEARDCLRMAIYWLPQERRLRGDCRDLEGAWVHDRKESRLCPFPA